jgi:hypothetical protein
MDPNETQDKAPEPNEAASAPEPAGDGERAKDAARDTDNSPQDDEPVDLERRILCPDGACIGVIGPDGTCKECGTPMDPADGPALARSAAADPGGAKPAPATTPVAAVGPPAIEDGTDDGLDLARRRLCSDGACIGVIGKDDTCKVCGKQYTGEPE